MEMNTNTTSTPRSGRRERSGTARFLVGLLKLLLLVFAIAAGVLLGWFGWQQFQFIDVVNDVQNRRISRLDSEVMRQNDVELLVRSGTATFSGEIDSLSGEIDDLSAAVATMAADNQALATTVNTQAEEIAALRAAQEEAASTIATVDTSLETLGSGLLALQQDISTSGADVDAIGAALDGLINDFDALATQVEEMEAMTSTVVISPTATGAGDVPLVTVAPDGQGEQLAIWRLWGLVLRTKLHLAEEDIDAAAASLNSAQTAAADLLENAEDELADSLTAVQEELDAAAADIDDKPAAANQTLDGVLDALDGLLNP